MFEGRALLLVINGSGSVKEVWMKIIILQILSILSVMINQFPIQQALSDRITEVLSKIASADILGAIGQGFKNEVLFIDEGSTMSGTAEVIIRQADGMCQVQLSAAFCQFLWIFSGLAISRIDYSALQESCGKAELSVEDLLKDLKLEASQFINLPIEDQDQIEHALSLLEFYEARGSYEKLLFSLIGSGKIDMEDFSCISFNTRYALKINSAYIYGIAFVLLHELFHFSLGHLAKEETMQDEVDADFSAFWHLYSDLPPDEKFTANCSILCVLFALLFRNPKLEADGIHPAEPERILTIYESIKDDDPMYMVMIVSLFSYWADLFKVEGFPQGLPSNEQSIREIRDFLSSNKSPSISGFYS